MFQDESIDTKDLFFEVAESRKTTVKAKLKELIPWILFVLIFVVLVFRSVSIQSRDAHLSNTNSPATVDVLVPMIPLAKGEAIRTELLKQIPLRIKDLTPRQRLDLLAHEQIKPHYFLRAKKNLPPHQILFWKDLEFSPSSSRIIQTPRIHYGGH